MNYKQNKNYFKISDKFNTIGVLVLGAGVVSMILSFIGFGSYIFYGLAGICLPSGFVMYLFGSILRATDDDIRVAVESATMGLEVDLTKDVRLSRKLIKNSEPRTLAGFDYNDGNQFMKAKNGQIISSSYTKALLYILSDEFYLSMRTISLIEDCSEDKILEIPFCDVKEILYLTENKTVSSLKNTYEVELTKIIINYGDDKTLELPISKDIEAEEYVNKLNRRITEFKASV